MNIIKNTHFDKIWVGIFSHPFIFCPTTAQKFINCGDFAAAQSPKANLSLLKTRTKTLKNGKKEENAAKNIK